MNTEPSPVPGQLVLDRRTRRTGVYMDTIGGRLYLRPVGGGVEWTARPEHVGLPAPTDPAPSAARPLPG
ncbi:MULTISPECIES: hypothetical protein [unclassified Streptomyces]|uniref:hypothetical protein n=1 Tax=Streptomycetaceae TaxID=2062 RepID=UPI002E768F81|nr:MULTISPECIES: hypothetical protein [unclassified Streptomyces]MED7948004.1 hypothetical protein [Streptomyces sp. BE303]MEE1822882.1 hypothetical protein [Streptomyces sp. BE20]